MMIADIFNRVESAIQDACSAIKLPTQYSNVSMSTRSNSTSGAESVSMSTRSNSTGVVDDIGELAACTQKYDTSSHIVLNIEELLSMRSFEWCTIRCGDFRIRAHPSAIHGVRVPTPEVSQAVISLYFEASESSGSCDVSCHLPVNLLKKQSGPLWMMLTPTDSEAANGEVLPRIARQLFSEGVNDGRHYSHIVESYDGSKQVDWAGTELEGTDCCFLCLHFLLRIQGVHMVSGAGGRKSGSKTVYIPDESEEIDTRLADILNTTPFLLRTVEIERISRGEYVLNGRPVKVTLGYELKCDKPLVFVSDGPLKQQLLDYLESTSTTEEYDNVDAVVTNSAIHRIPKHNRLSFEMQGGLPQSRLDAMKLATKEAQAREVDAAAQIERERNTPQCAPGPPPNTLWQPPVPLPMGVDVSPQAIPPSFSSATPSPSHCFATNGIMSPHCSRMMPCPPQFAPPQRPHPNMMQPTTPMKQHQLPVGMSPMGPPPPMAMGLPAPGMNGFMPPMGPPPTPTVMFNRPPSTFNHPLGTPGSMVNPPMPPPGVCLSPMKSTPPVNMPVNSMPMKI